MTQQAFSPGGIHAEHYKLLIEQATEHAVMLISPEGQISSWNPGAERLLGYVQEEVLGKQFSIFYRPQDEESGKAERALGISLQAGRYEDFSWLVRKDGTRFWANIIISPIYNDQKELIGYAQITRDLMERRLAEEDLLRTREEFRVLADFLPHVVWTANAGGFIVYWNRSFYMFTGLDPKQIQAAKVHDVVHPDDVQHLRETWRDAVMTGADFEAEFRLKSKEGDYHWHVARAVAIKNQDGKPVKWIGAAIDINEQRVSMERKDEFIGIAGHELRTPLTSMKAYIQLLEQSLNENDIETARKYTEKTHTFIDRLNKLVSDLLDISKIDRGKLPLEFSEFSIDDFIHDAVEVQQKSVTTHKIHVQGKAGVKVRADKARLEQVVTNYISNAIKYSPDADRVDVIVEHSQGWITVTVKDYGIGIPAGQVKSVFNKFFRASNKKSNIQGLGLGLYISAEIVRMHGGSVGVNSEEKKGTIFWFRIPVYISTPPDHGVQE